jgi:biotin transport system substrate-specific component
MNAATLRYAAVPRTGLLADAILVTGGALFIALSAQIAIVLPFTPVPLTLQTFAVLLVGAAFGTFRGALTALVYLAMGVVGLPVFAEQSHGLAVVLGATGGYLLGFVFAAAFAGYLAQRQWDRRFSSATAAMLTSTVIIYAFGLTWLAQNQNLDFSTTLEYGLYPFVAGDIVKLYAAGLLLPVAWRLVARLKRED